MEELDYIRVESVGRRDLVYLAGTEIRAFAVSCPKPPRPDGRVVLRGQYTLSDKFKNGPVRDMIPVFLEYLHWKQARSPGLFRMTEHSGKLKSGERHPWHKLARPRPRP